MTDRQTAARWSGPAIIKLAVGAGALLLLAIFGAASLAVAEDAASSAPVKPASEDHPLSELRSGYDYQPPHVRRIQDADIKNPGMLWFAYGGALWSRADGAADKSCADCHNVAEKAMRGVGARYPKIYPPEGKPITLSRRINLCRTLNMKAKPWRLGSDEMVAMTTYVRAQSRGMPMRVKTDGQAAPFVKAGKAQYYSPRGELQLSCASCHERQVGKTLRAATVSQGHSNGFPAYKISTERVEPLHRQLQACDRRVQAKPLSLGADPYVNLELYLVWRGGGLPVETPAVRNW